MSAAEGRVLDGTDTWLSRAWRALPPDERAALFGCLTGSLGIPLVLVLVVDPFGAALEPLRIWLFFLGLPAYVLARVIHRWVQGDSLLRASLRDLRPALDSFAIGARNVFRLPLGTLCLIVANVTLFYSVSDPWDYSLRIADAELWAWTNWSSMFMHGDEGHLWGNMLFLWIFGSAVEPRVGWLRFLVYYLIAGTAGNALSVAFDAFVGNDLAYGVGASGAIYGVMGLFAVRCYFTRVGIAIPIFGALGAAAPIGYRVQVNAMVLVGLYVCFDLLGAQADLRGDGSHVGHMAHLGGYAFAVCVAFATGLALEGRRERLVELASQPVDFDGVGPDHEARDRALEHDPANVELRLARARDRSKYVRLEEGREDYEAAIRRLQPRDPGRAASVFVELFARYGTALAPKEQLALTPALERIGAFDTAARALERVAAAPGIAPADRERALLRQAQLLVSMRLTAAAAHVYERLLREPASSEGRALAEAKLRRCRASEAAAPA